MQDRIAPLIFEFTVPGQDLDSEDREWCRRVERLLYLLEAAFVEANLSLNLFLEASAEPKADWGKEESDRRNKRRDEIWKEVEREVMAETPDEYWFERDFGSFREGLGGRSHETLEKIHFESEARLAREEWASGRLPRALTSKKMFLFAKSFVYALDSFDKALGALLSERNIPARVAELHSELERAFRDLRGVRDTAHHPEDRIRRLGKPKRGKQVPLDIKAVGIDGDVAPAGTLLSIGNIGTNGSAYSSTMADGHHGSVEVSAESMERLQRIFQDVLDSFHWSGSRRAGPR